MLPAFFFFLRIALAIAFGYLANDAEHLFNVLICHLYSLSSEMSVHISCSFSNRIFKKLLSVQFL